MPDIYISKKDSAGGKIYDICLRYLMRKNYQSEIYDLSAAAIPDSAAVFLIRYDSRTEEFSRKIRSINSRNYIVVLLENPNDIKKAVTPGICPSGLLIKPFEKNDVETVLDEIFSDYFRCNANEETSGSFVFKQKAKEYSIPFEKIILFESRNKRIMLRTETQEFEFYGTLDSVMENIPECFMKIHKSFIVNLSRIISADYGAMTVEFDDGSAAYMSRTYKGLLKEKLSERSGEICSQRTS